MESNDQDKNRYSIFGNWGSGPITRSQTKNVPGSSENVLPNVSDKMDTTNEDTSSSPANLTSPRNITSPRSSKCAICFGKISTFKPTLHLRCFICHRVHHVNCVANNKSVNHCIQFLKEPDNLFNLVTFVCSQCREAHASGENLSPASNKFVEEINSLKNSNEQKDNVIRDLETQVKDLKRGVKVGGSQLNIGNTPKRPRINFLEQLNTQELQESEMNLAELSDMALSPDLPIAKMSTVINSLVDKVNMLTDKLSELTEIVKSKKRGNERNDSNSDQISKSKASKSTSNVNSNTNNNANSKKSYAGIVKENLSKNEKTQVATVNKNADNLIDKLKSKTFGEILQNRKIKNSQIRNISIVATNEEERKKVIELLNTDELAKDIKIINIVKKSVFTRVIFCKSDAEAKKLDELVFKKYGDAVSCAAPVSRMQIKVVNVPMGRYSIEDLCALLCSQNEIEPNKVSIDRSYEISRKNKVYANMILNCQDIQTFKYILEKGSLILFFNKYKVFECTELNQCKNCSDYGHISVNCKAKPVCRWCAGGHLFKDCTERDKKPRCSNCIKFNKKSEVKNKIDHMPSYDICPVRQARVFELKKFFSNSKN